VRNTLSFYGLNLHYNLRLDRSSVIILYFW
jgi:hypothetical protein